MKEFDFIVEEYEKLRKICEANHRDSVDIMYTQHSGYLRVKNLCDPEEYRMESGITLRCYLRGETIVDLIESRVIKCFYEYTKNGELSEESYELVYNSAGEDDHNIGRRMNREDMKVALSKLLDKVFIPSLERKFGEEYIHV